MPLTLKLSIYYIIFLSKIYLLVYFSYISTFEWLTCNFPWLWPDSLGLINFYIAVSCRFLITGCQYLLVVQIFIIIKYQFSYLQCPVVSLPNYLLAKLVTLIMLVVDSPYVARSIDDTFSLVGEILGKSHSRIKKTFYCNDKAPN